MTNTINAEGKYLLAVFQTEADVDRLKLVLFANLSRADVTPDELKPDDPLNLQTIALDWLWKGCAVQLVTKEESLLITTMS